MSALLASAPAAAAIRAALEARPDGVLDDIARKHGASLQAVFGALPPEAARWAPGSRFAEIWGELAGWGRVTFIVHTEDGVFETKAALPQGGEGGGYFNINGPGPLGGHIRAGRCAAIYFIDRPFFGRRSCSVQFINIDGGAMFKVFVGRDERGALLADQVERFERLRADVATGAET